MHTSVVIYFNYLKDSSFEQLFAHHTTFIGAGKGGDCKAMSHFLVLEGVEVISVMADMLITTETLKQGGLAAQTTSELILEKFCVLNFCKLSETTPVKLN